MSDGEQFGRVCDLVVGGRRWSGLRVTLQAKLSLTPKPNQGEIEVYGLGADSRAYLERPGAVVTVLAGYGDQMAVAFTGEVWQARSKKSEADMVTTIKANDGTAAYLSHVRRAWGSNTARADVVKELAAQMGLTASPATLALVKGVYKGPRAVQGPAAYALEAIAQRAGLHWSIDTGRLQLTPFDGTTTESEVVLARETGLVGWPETGERKEGQPALPQGKGGTLKVDALFNPMLRSGVRVRVVAENGRGHYRLDEVELDLDSADEGRWLCHCTLRPLGV